MNRVAGAFAFGCGVLSASLSVAEPATTSFAQVEGGRVYYETCGSAQQAVVLIHDGVLQSSTFDAMWQPLCSRYRVLRYDRRGYGRSPASTGPYSALDDIDAVMKAAVIAHAALVGVSAGGGLALEFAQIQPAKVDKLVLIGADMPGYPVSALYQVRAREILAPAQRGDIAGMISAIAKAMTAPGDTAAQTEISSTLQASPQNFTHKEMARPLPPLTAKTLNSVQIPTLVINGEADTFESNAQGGALQALLPNARRVVIPGAGHLANIEAPGAVTEQVEQFVGNPTP